MTLPVQVPRAQIAATAGQTVFPFAWQCDDAALVIVFVDDVQAGGFGVALNADQVGAPGGTITLAAPCVGSEVVTVERVSPQSQITALTRYGPFAADNITKALDRIVMLSQEASAVVSKCLRAARSQLSKFSSLELPPPVDGGALIFLADAFSPGHYKFTTAIAATKEYLETYINQFIANAGVVQPVSWVMIGDDVNTDFAIAGAVLNSPALYVVTLDGVLQEPTTDYTIDIAALKIKFTAIVPINVRILVRTLGYAKAVTLDTISGDLGDGDRTLTVAVSPIVNRFATALTVNRTVTLSAAGATAGSKFRVVRTGLGAFTLNVGGLKTIPISTAAFVDVMYDGAAWRLTAYGTL